KVLYLNPILKFAVIVDTNCADLANPYISALHTYDFLIDALHFTEVTLFGELDDFQSYEDRYPTGRDYSEIAQESSRDAVRTSIQRMAEKADDNDIICVFLIGHGGYYSKKNVAKAEFLVAKNEYYKDSDLYSDLSSTQAAKIFIYTEFCFDGGFHDDFDDFPRNERLFIWTHAPIGHNINEYYSAILSDHGYMTSGNGKSNFIGIIHTPYGLETSNSYYNGYWNLHPEWDLETLYNEIINYFPKSFDMSSGKTAYYYPTISDYDSTNSFYIHPYEL
ncbi:MAG: hypothetical protein ACTSUR_00735, partial [Candidatus Heimdallarchaeaceae archaeon]